MASVNFENLPEMFWEVIVYLKLRLARLEVEDAIGIHAVITQTLNSALSVAFSGILSLEYVLESLGSHDWRIKRYRVVRNCFRVKASARSLDTKKCRG